MSLLNRYSEDMDDIKRRLRSLKKLEIKIRFGGSFHAANYAINPVGKPVNLPLIWDEFFCVDSGKCSKARYLLQDIASMKKEEFRNIVDEFFFRVYYKYYTENGITGSRLYDPEILSWMGLPPDAGPDEIKKKFRELAKKYHPDTGGDNSSFIKLMDNYHKLVE